MVQASRFPATYAALALVGLMAATGLSACHPSEKGKDEKAGPAASLTVTTEPVRALEVPVMIAASGTIGAWQDAPIGAETGGLTATAVLAEEGDYVRQGQVLVQMNDTLLQAQLRQASAQVASARAQMNEAEKAFGRAKELSDKGFLSASSLDQRQAALQTTQAAVMAAEAGQAEVRARLAQAQVRAPVDGLITKRSVVKGQIVSPGVELFRMVREGRLELNAEITEADIRRLKPGMSARVIGEGGVETTGTIRLVTPMIDAQTRLAYARITLPANAALKPGMFARTQIDTGVSEALSVPMQAVVYREGQPSVFVIGEKNKVSLRRVKTGERAGDRILIRDGLKTGETIAVKGAAFLVDGDTVRVGGAASPAPAKSAKAS
ncbi:MAG: efflux RND transporter periplasmic adaptor subunit [Asticcacaulis sp.]